MSDSLGNTATAEKDASSALTTTVSKESHNAWFTWLEQWRIGDQIGILGLLLTLIGFWLTFREAKRSRTAAEAAKAAAEETRHVRQLVDISLELNSVREHLVELKKTVLSDDWTSIANRIDSLIQSLGTARLEMFYGTDPYFTDADRETLSNVVKVLREFEPLIARKGAIPPNQSNGQTRLHNKVVTPLSGVIDAVDDLRYKAKSLSARR